ncbi:phosphoadenosine phosphosulfate reductase family protein [Cytobacillus oceanisediminis]|uniref:phosphoadenosine phosphosulfate reductase domain-containing protein n=1 Tax=Cytobacillus oceanisediminis TaxID=665099 RepID=UPI00203EC08E|nr:phosphoadenosine phosphosulfate reductase family protein [Cytobacillus oceanisediminis]MCM3402965.1 phosphoadenosine phosphosulfate reductase family protein [Cytobacillus oceanisediminis]
MNKDLITLAERLTVPLPKEMDHLSSYRIHANCSGGKDSVAVVLMLLYGYKVPKENIELVHMRVDADEDAFFDWKETDEYLDYLANKLELPLVILRGEKSLKARIEDRRKFPSGQTQFCTSYTKRDVYSKWVRGLGPGKFLCASGERAAESARRAGKPVFQVYKAANAPTKNRQVDWLRPIHHLDASAVWELMRLANIDPHPCYQYVYRCSCKFCIYLSPQEMKTVSEMFPEEFQELVRMEESFGHTMRFEKKEPLSLLDFIKKANDEKGQLALFELPCMA